MSRAKHDVPGGRWAWFTPQRLVVIALMLGLLLRFLCLGSKSIWLDEVLSVRAARAELGAFASGSVERYHPPLFFLILKGFMRLGTDEALLRLPAAIGGSAAVLLIYVLSRSLFDMATAVSATWFAALAPLLVWYSQEVRGYSLLVMWALLALVALAHLALQRGAGWWLVYVAATTAGLYTHYTFVLVLLVQLLMVVGLLAAGRGTRAAPLYLAAGWLAAAVLYVPWLRTPAAGAFIDRLTSASLYYNALTAGRPELLQNVSGAALAWFLIGGGLMALGLGTWLYRIAYNAALMRLRKRPAPTESLDEPVTSESGDQMPRQLVDWGSIPDDLLLKRELHTVLKAALETLPATLRSVFVLRDIEGLSTAETAEVLALTETNVKVRLHRARVALRERLTGYFAASQTVQGIGGK